MLQNFRSRPRNIKLDKQAGLPSVKFLEEVRQKALVNAGAIVEVPFGDDTQSFNLTVTRDVTHGSWLWMLYRDDGFESGLVWSHVTHDADYIYTLISNSNPGLIFTKPRTAGSQEQHMSLLPAEEQLPRVRKGTLEGNLRNIQIANLLQSVSMGQMTGRLEIASPNDRALVYFVDGQPVHATLRGAEGTEALIQVMALEDGEFAFFNERPTVPTTITRGLTGLLMEGATFIDHSLFLKNAGLTHDAFLIPLKPVRTDAELEEALRNGVDCDLSKAVAIFERSDGSRTWAEILRDLELTKSEWVPLLFNLVNCGLLKISSTPMKVVRQASSEQNIDWSVLQAFEHTMCRTDTGLYTHPALLYFLRQELYRYADCELPFSLIVFGYCEKTNDPNETRFIAYRSRAIGEMRERIHRIKRKNDLLCHYGAFSYALLLPLTVKTSAMRQAEIVAEICGDIKISEDYSPSQIEFRAGVANLPGDSLNLEDILAIAENVRAFSN